MLSIITPSSGRAEAFSFLERWVASQEVDFPYEWIVSTSDSEGYQFTMNQRVIANRPRAGQRDLNMNVHAALGVCNGDKVVVMEDDDFYEPGYLREMGRLLDRHDLVGLTPARYYNVATRRYKIFRNDSHASLAQTGFRRDAIRTLSDLCLTQRDFIDNSLWHQFEGTKHLARDTELHVGIKGMPGRKGLGIGHHATMGKSDQSLEMFHRFGIPDLYLSYYRDEAPPSDRVAPLSGKGRPQAWAGVLPVKPWDFPVTVAIPTLGDPRTLVWAMETLRAGTVSPYFLIIDTGSHSDHRDDLEALRSDDTEVHYIQSHGWRHPSEPVTAAMDLAFTLCKTEHLYCTHSDCFAMRPDLLEWYLAQCDERSPAVGYRMSDRSWITQEWEWMIGHVSAMLHMPTMYRHGITWSMGRYLAMEGPPLHKSTGWTDTEVSFNYRLRDAGIAPTLFHGDQNNYRRNTDGNIDHVRTYPGSKVYRVADSTYRHRSEDWMRDALEKAAERVARWNSGLAPSSSTTNP